MVSTKPCRQTQPIPPILSFIPSTRPPFPHPNPSSFNPHLCPPPLPSIYSFMISSQLNAHIQVCERLFVHTLWNHCPPLKMLSSHSAPVFNLYSDLRAAPQEKGWGGRGPEIHLSQISTNLALIFTSRRFWLILFSSHAGNLHASSSGGNPALTLVSQ